MKYLHKPTSIRTCIQVYRKGIKYTIKVIRFKDNGSIRHKDIYEVYTPFSVKHIVKYIIEEAVISGIRLSEIEVYNHTAIKIDYPIVKIQSI